MKKFLLFVLIFCMLSGALSVSAENYHLTESISLGETKIITIPKPNGKVDEGWVYFTQEFTFVPEEDGTYRFLVAYEENSKKPYDFSMGVAGAYRELENGCEFDAIAGETYELCFQYNNHDGRYPTFTFFLGTQQAGMVPMPEPLPVGSLLSDNILLYCAAGTALFASAALFAWVALLLIRERKKNN